MEKLLISQNSNFKIQNLYFDDSQSGFKYFHTENNTQIMKISMHDKDQPYKCNSRCKVLKKENSYQISYQLLSDEKILQHTNVFQEKQELFLDSSTKIYGCTVTMEKANCCVFKQIFKKKNYQPFKLTLETSIKICECIKFIHDKGMAHNNIKSENFLHFYEGDQIKIGGLGYLSKDDEKFTFQQFYRIFKKRKDFASYEIQKALNERYSLLGPDLNIDFKKSDIFDLGYVLFELVYQVKFQHFFGYPLNYQKFLKNFKKNFTVQGNQKQEFFYPIIKNCLNQNMDDRNDIDNILTILNNKLQDMSD
ncbi:Protein kinase-like domain [Pseudocohnilembus persalinus]|uniref:Protein kinase-like domain n=1 Tax=Pseudocohnilembus persalinus TaxID=266149 RepID=A0A0V0QT54_PSEPJ|nr:Protein kinase-like domain [Pseudocohnilembus persalinus]|eukprot:KRX05555.1 Protein kinase-like domain [Pseudocohnilembus persalinus]